MNEEHMLSCVSFLLGTIHSNILNILNQQTTHEYKIDRFSELERRLYKDISRFYYPVTPNPNAQVKD